jgi:two-component sensor histidine kinase
VELHWRESGLAAIAAPDRSGFGSKLIESSVKHDLAGQVQTTYAPEGVGYVFRFPIVGTGA